MRFSRIFATAFLAVMPASLVGAAEGVDETSVTFAQVAALDGPAAALGQGMRAGIGAAFAEANAAGGVHGREVRLESFDDGYEPDRAVQQVKAVISGDSHIALIGGVGTPTSAAVQPLATEAGLPFIGAFTGAGFLRDAGHGNIFNIRATYAAETEAWIAHLVDEAGLSRIAVLYQDDGFGRSGHDGVVAALDQRGLEPVATGSYTRNTVAVKSALLRIRKADPEAIVMVGASKPVAEFVRLAARVKLDPVFVNISFGGDALAQELGSEGEGLIISQVVPFPADTAIPLVAEYRQALADHAPGTEPGFVSLEGYIVGRVALAALDGAGPALDRAAFLSALQDMRRLDFGGVSLNYGPEDNQGMDAVYLTRITADGTLEPLQSGQGS